MSEKKWASSCRCPIGCAGRFISSPPMGYDMLRRGEYCPLRTRSRLKKTSQMESSPGKSFGPSSFLGGICKKEDLRALDQTESPMKALKRNLRHSPSSPEKDQPLVNHGLSHAVQICGTNARFPNCQFVQQDLGSGRSSGV